MIRLEAVWDLFQPLPVVNEGPNVMVSLSNHRRFRYKSPFDPFDKLRAGQLRVTSFGCLLIVSIRNPNSFLLLLVLMMSVAYGQAQQDDRPPIDMEAKAAVDTSSIGSDDPQAVALAREVIDALGGEKAWSDLSWNLAFDFVSVRDGKEAARFSHQWNRRTNAAVVSGLAGDGRRWKVRFDDVYARTGSATIDGAPAADTALPRLLESAHARFINDTYWLLMPSKLLDAGVNLRRLEDTTVADRPYQRLSLSFDSVGLTPGDQYWLFIDPQTKRVAFWRFLLQSGRAGEFAWEEYERFGPVTLPRVRRAADGAVAIRFENIRVGDFEVE